MGYGQEFTNDTRRLNGSEKENRVPKYLQTPIKHGSYEFTVLMNASTRILEPCGMELWGRASLISCAFGFPGELVKMQLLIQ